MSQPGGLTAIALPQLEQLLRGIESGDLATPVTSAALQARGMGAHWTDVAWLASLGRPSIEAVLRVAIAERKTRPAPRLELVWTGPEVRASSARDTAVVVRELFARARTRVLVAGYAFRGGRDIFEGLHQGMRDRGVGARIILHLDDRDGAIGEGDVASASAGLCASQNGCLNLEMLAKGARAGCRVDGRQDGGRVLGGGRNVGDVARDHIDAPYRHHGVVRHARVVVVDRV